MADIVDPDFPHDDDRFAMVAKAWSIADEAGRAVPLAWANATLAAHEKK